VLGASAVGAIFTDIEHQMTNLRRGLLALLSHLRFRSRSPEESYLDQSVDLADLERRVQHLSRDCVDNARQRLSFMAWARS
jgi:CII-binding regulator of phage lambda lysogenization HflD